MTSSAESVTVEKVILKPSWLQDQSDDEPKSSRPLVLEILVSGILAAALLFLRGAPQLLVGLLLTLWIGISVFSRVRRNSMGLRTWSGEEKSEGHREMPLEKKSKMMKRALKNREVTQAMIEERIRNLLLQKIKNKKNFSDDEIDILLKNPKNLSKVIDDRVLTYFLLNGKRYKDVMQSTSSDSDGQLVEKIRDPRKRDETYGKWLNEILKRIGDWP